MSGSESKEMALEIASHLRPRLPSPDLTMNKLLLIVIGIYVEQLDQGGMTIPFSTFLLAGYWFSFENKTGGRSKKCFNEITLSLKVITMDDFLKLSDWNGTVVSKGDPIPDDQCPPVRTTAPLPMGEKTKQALTKAQAKRAREASSTAPRKKKARNTGEPTGLESKGTLSVTQLHQSVLKPLGEATGSRQKDAKKIVVDLSEHSCNPTHPLVNTIQEGEWDVQDNTQVKHVDLSDRITTEERCSRIRDYQKNFVLLKNAHLQCSNMERELSDRLKDMEQVRDEWRQTTFNQVEKIKLLEGDLWPKSKQLSDLKGRVRVLEEEKAKLVRQLAQSEMARQGVIKDFVPTVVGRLLTSVKYRKSLAVPTGLCYTAGWLGGLSLGRKEEEIVVSPDVPSPTMNDQVDLSFKNDGGGLAKLDSPKARLTKNFADASLKTAV
nr:hypothetical protein [Tanacetum cinerariifolium]